MDDLTRQLGQLERIQLVRRLDDAELAYLFKHVLAQETTYQSLLVKTRREIHLRVARYYEQVYAGSPDNNAAILAHHYFEAGDLVKTFHYALMAGDVAARLYAHPEALMHYERALQALHQLSGIPDAVLLERAEISRLYTNRGRVFELSNRYELAAENYIEMEAAGRAQGNPTLELAGLTLRAILLSTYTSLFDPVKGNELNVSILARARELGDRAVEARIHWIMLLLAKYGEGNMEQAIEHGERSLALARELGLREQIAYTLNDLASPYGMSVKFGQSRAVLEEAIDIWKDLGNLAMLSDTIANLIQLDYYAGDLDGATRASAEALRLSQMTGSLWGQAYSQMWVGTVFAEQGDYGTAFRVMEECIRTAEAANFLPAQVATRTDHGWILGELGLLEQARQEVERASILVKGIPPFAIFVLAVQLRLSLLAGDLAAAEQVGAPELFRGGSPFQNDPDAMSRFALAEAELALAQKDYPRVLAKLNPAIEFLETYHVAAFLPELLYLKSQVLDRQGQTESALAILAEAQRAAEALPSRRMLWQILGARSEMESKRGNKKIAQELRAQAREVVEYIVARLGSTEREISFMALPQVRSLFQEG